MNNCKKCQSDNIELLSTIENIKYKGNDISISIEYFVCKTCKNECVSKQQIHNNDCKLRGVKKVVDRLFTSQETKQAGIN